MESFLAPLGGKVEISERRIRLVLAMETGNCNLEIGKSGINGVGEVGMDCNDFNMTE